MYVSTVSVEELRLKDSMEEVMSNLGIYTEGYFLQPARCPECGGYVYVLMSDEDKPQSSQCFSCGKMLPVYYSETFNLRKDWIKGE